MFMIFAGAGASKAVRPQQYPTTVEFFDLLPVAVTDNKLFKFAVDFVKSTQKAEQSLDIEQVLWLIHELREFSQKVHDKRSVVGWFVRGNRLASIADSNEQISQLANVASGALASIDALTSRINALVYEFYSDVPSEEDLKPNWISLLRKFKQLAVPIEIVTTNYDIVIEEAIRLCDVPVLSGRTIGNQPILDSTMWDVKGLSTEQFLSFGRLTKLHGSVDWVRGKSGRIHVGTPTFQGMHERHAIIYPGFKGPPLDNLFQSMHRYFQARIADAEVIIFIGYAFRDEYINAILERDLNRESRIYVLNPADRLHSIPFAESRVTHIKGSFDQVGVEELLNLIESYGLHALENHSPN